MYGRAAAAGGPVYMSGRGGGNNFPLRGGKASNFEGMWCRARAHEVSH